MSREFGDINGLFLHHAIKHCAEECEGGAFEATQAIGEVLDVLYDIAYACASAEAGDSGEVLTLEVIAARSEDLEIACAKMGALSRDIIDARRDALIAAVVASAQPTKTERGFRFALPPGVLGGIPWREREPVLRRAVEQMARALGLDRPYAYGIASSSSGGNSTGTTYNVMENGGWTLEGRKLLRRIESEILEGDTAEAMRLCRAGRDTGEE